MKARWKILIALGVMLLIIVLVGLVTMRFRPESELEAYKQFLRSHGEKLDINDVLPPPVLPESNSVESVRETFRLLGSGNVNVPYAMLGVAPGKAAIGWQQPDVRGYDFTNSWENLAAECAADQPALKLLHQVLDRPTLDFQLAYTQGATLLLPHLAPMKRVTQRLSAAAVGDLHADDTGGAATNIILLLALVQRDAQEGLLISHLVRIAMTSIAITPTWELLQHPKATDDQLAQVQKSWEQLDFLSDATNAYTMERVWGIMEIERLRNSPDEFKKVVGFYSSTSGSGGSAGGSWSLESLTERPRYAIGIAMWRSSWSYEDELHNLKSAQIILEALRAMQTNRAGAYKADYDVMVSRIAAAGITNTSRFFLTALKIPDFEELSSFSFGTAVSKMLRIETTRRIVITAIALKRYQLRHGHLPEKLAELTPEFLPTVFVDPMIGKPLRYQNNGDGTYLLYSVGENGVDDGGNSSLPPGVTSRSFNWQNPKALDWVWPQPATAEEVQYFYEHPPK